MRMRVSGTDQKHKLHYQKSNTITQPRLEVQLATYHSAAFTFGALKPKNASRWFSSYLLVAESASSS